MSSRPAERRTIERGMVIRATAIVAGSATFGAKDYAAAIAAIRATATAAAVRS